MELKTLIFSSVCLVACQKGFLRVSLLVGADRVLQQWAPVIDGVHRERESRSLEIEVLIMLCQEAFCVLFVITNTSGEWPCFS